MEKFKECSSVSSAKYKECSSVNLDHYYANIRYTPTVAGYVIRGYCPSVGKLDNIKVLEVDLIRIIEGEGHECLSDLDNQSYEDIVFIRNYYNLSMSVLLAAQKQWHRKRLGRCLTSAVYLKRKVVRKPPVYEYGPNLEIYPILYRKAVVGGRTDLYFNLNKEWCRYFRIRYVKKEWFDRYKKLKEVLIDSPEYINSSDVFAYQNECMKDSGIVYL